MKFTCSSTPLQNIIQIYITITSANETACKSRVREGVSRFIPSERLPRSVADTK
jgi:hypothetical protein